MEALSPPHPGRLQDRVAFITGSSSGLGRAISHVFALEGAFCFLVDKYANPRNKINTSTGKADDWNNRAGNDDKVELGSHVGQESRLSATSTSMASSVNEPQDGDGSSGKTRMKKAVYEITTSQRPTYQILQDLVGNERIHFHEADLTDEHAVQAAVSECVRKYRRIDILVNSHGISVESTHSSLLRCHETPLNPDYTMTQNINTTSFFLTCKAVLSVFLSQPLLDDETAPSSFSSSCDGDTESPTAPRGVIVNISSLQSQLPFHATPSYCVSKGGVLMLSRQIALDYAPDAIRCNTICPGFLDTDMTRNLQSENGPMMQGVLNRQCLNLDPLLSSSSSTTNNPRRQLGNVHDVARMVLVMASDDSRWMTGQAVVVDGGYSIS